MPVRRVKMLIAAGLMAAAVVPFSTAQESPAAAKPASKPTPQLGSPTKFESVPAMSAGVGTSAPQACGSVACGMRPDAPGKAQSCKQKLKSYFWSDQAAIVPLGMNVCQPFQQQATNGVAARMTLYDYDFVCGTDKLSVRGKERLRLISCYLGQTAFPVVIEYDMYKPDLSAARRVSVINELSAASITVPDDRVVVANPAAIPKQGIEAEIIYQNLLTQTQSLGFPLYNRLYGASGGGGVGGFSGFNLGNVIGGGGGSNSTPAGGGNSGR